ncbi:hypothetical protein HK102_002557, partial [Quaeritorhiza haematococci]
EGEEEGEEGGEGVQKDREQGRGRRLEGEEKADSGDNLKENQEEEKKREGMNTVGDQQRKETDARQVERESRRRRDVLRTRTVKLFKYCVDMYVGCKSSTTRERAQTTSSTKATTPSSPLPAILPRPPPLKLYHPFVSYITQDLLESVSAHASYRFIVTTNPATSNTSPVAVESQKDPKILMWLLNWDVSVASNVRLGETGRWGDRGSEQAEGLKDVQKLVRMHPWLVDVFGRLGDPSRFVKAVKILYVDCTDSLDEDSERLLHLWESQCTPVSGRQTNTGDAALPAFVPIAGVLGGGIERLVLPERKFCEELLVALKTSTDVFLPQGRDKTELRLKIPVRGVGGGSGFVNGVFRVGFLPRVLG